MYGEAVADTRVQQVLIPKRRSDQENKQSKQISKVKVVPVQA